MAQSFNSGLKALGSQYAKLLKAKVTSTTIQKTIEENSYYPSLLSISETFNKFRISNSAFEVKRENFEILEAPFAAYVYMPDTGKDFVLVTDVNSSSISFLYKSNKEQSISKTEFLKRFQEVVWIAEPDSLSGEADYQAKRNQEKRETLRKATWSTVLGLTIITGYISALPSSGQLSFAAISLIKLAALATSILLLVYEVDKSNPFVKNLCAVGGKTNCDAVLSSGGAKLLGVTWSELGYFYFASSTILLFNPSVPFSTKVFWIALANAFASPYIIFSVFYQWKVVKQWCPLCLAVQVCLLSELVWSIVNYWTFPVSFVISFPQYLSLFFCLTLPLLFWYGIKRVFSQAKDSVIFESAYKRLQYNPEIFFSLLHQQKRAPDGWQNLGITVGNPDATTRILKVCNPYCGPCSEAHKTLENIISNNTRVNLQIIFTSKNTENDISAPIVRHLMAIAETGNKELIQKSLHDWYLSKEKNYERFNIDHPLNIELRQMDSSIDAMADWCEKAEVTLTPTIFINGFLLPENYNVDELRNLI